MCVRVSLRAEEEWKGLHDRTQKIPELDESDWANNVDDVNEGNQNTIENDSETRRRVRVHVGVGVGVLVGVLVFPPQSRLRGSWIEIGESPGASHETHRGTDARRTESSNRSALVLGDSLDIAQMGRCVLQSGPLLPDGWAG